MADDLTLMAGRRLFTLTLLCTKVICENLKKTQKLEFPTELLQKYHKERKEFRKLFFSWAKILNQLNPGLIQEINIISFLGTNSVTLDFSNLKGFLTKKGAPLVVKHCGKSLVNVNLMGCEGLRKEGLEILVKGIPKLKILNLGLTKIDDSALEVLKNSSTLRNLSLRGCRLITTAGVTDLLSGVQLDHLDLWGCKQLTSKIDQGIILQKNLSYLNTIYVPLEDSALKNLTKAKLTKMKYLHLGSSGNLCFSDSSLERLLETLPLLQHLSLINCPEIFKEKDSVAWFKYLNELNTLTIENCINITDQHLQEIFTLCTSLTSLSIGYCNTITTKAILNGISQLSTLRTNQATTEGEGSPTTKAGLSFLDIHNCKSIDEESYQKLKKHPLLTDTKLVYF